MAKWEIVNYFEFYALPVALQLDQVALKKKFYALSRDFHPDFHTQASEEEQEKMLRKSTMNNSAFKVLSDFDQRLKYVLELSGKLKEEGENKVPNDFLMEMMELNEGLMELEMEPSEEKNTAIREEILHRERDARSVIEGVLQKNAVETVEPAEWDLLVDFYLKSRYLWRLRDSLDKLSSEGSLS